MNHWDELAYDIEQLWIEGESDIKIAETLQIPLEWVEGWTVANGLQQRAEYDPFSTINS
jgi:hypothetical protein